MSYLIELENFVSVADKQITGQGTTKEATVFNQNRLKKYSDLKVDVSFGMGRATAIPWITFLGENQFTSNGIFPVFLYFKEKKLLFLAYGISETNTPEKKWYSENLKTLKTYFIELGLGQPEKYGNSYFYKIYDLNKYPLNKQIDNDLDEIIEKYKSLLNNKFNNSFFEKKYWIYAPGENAIKWNEFYKSGIMALGWDDIGDLNQFKTRDEIRISLLNAYGGEGSKMNDVSANDDFKNKVNIGDIVIVKKGLSELIGYGEVTSDYFFDINRNDYRSCRKVNWKLKGNWKVDHRLVLKTFTDITKYLSDSPEYDTYYNQLIGIMLHKPNGTSKETLKNMDFDIEQFQSKLIKSGLIFSPQLIQRFVASLCTKPFVICSGLSGSGKTKLAQAFVKWICESEKQYKIIPVGADWTNREPLLGYPNGLVPKDYVMPDSGALQLILDASKNESKPYFLILDEMNLSHVERYFADFLSIMESKDCIKLYDGNERKSNKNDIPKEIYWPKNLFVVGTVNIDETTYMFSPKVLDRANVIEFRITETEMQNYLGEVKQINMNMLLDKGIKGNAGAGYTMAADFLKIALEKHPTINNTTILVELFKELQKAGAEFGYRSASEINELIGVLKLLTKDQKEFDENDLLDIAIMQKLLPKLHGSRNKLSKVLPVLGGFCLADNSKIKEDYLDKFVSNSLTDVELKSDTNIKYKISFEKICRMYKNAVENGFASYAEA